MRSCSLCKINKLLSCFYKSNVGKNGIHSRCKECCRKIVKKYRRDNPEKHKESKKKWQVNNLEKYRDGEKRRSARWGKNNPDRAKEVSKDWHRKHPEYSYKMSTEQKKRKYEREKLREKTDIYTKISRALRKRLRIAIKRGQKSGSAVRDLGCSIKQFIVYFESKFLKDMSWGNYGKWHIDHIIPLSSFDLTSPLDFKKACHYSNLQPLWAQDNLKKSSKILRY